MITSDYGMRISDIEDKLSTLERLTKESTQNIESLETKFYQKIEIMELKLLELQNKTFFETQKGRSLMKKLGKLKLFLIKKAMIPIMFCRRQFLNVICIARNFKVHLIC